MSLVCTSFSEVTDYESSNRVRLLTLLCPGQLWGAPSLLFTGYLEAFFRGLKRPEREAE